MTTTPRAEYFVHTYDYELGRYTPQDGVSEGPHTLFGLREVLRALRKLGFQINRPSAFDVYVWKKDPSKARAA